MSDDLLTTATHFSAPLTIYLEILQKQLDHLSETLMVAGDHNPALWKEKGHLEQSLNLGKSYRTLQADLLDLQQALKTTSPNDAEMADLLRHEITDTHHRLLATETLLLKVIAPLDERNDATAILEIRPGAGGEEASLFAAELADVYAKFSRKNKWGWELLEHEKTSLGGLKSFSTLISGHDVWEKLFFESGVHRVQRVPETESSGRIHTSTVTVALLREPQDVDLVIPEKDLKVDVFRSSGPGGQSVNTTDSAVRLTHIPTGISVQQQDEKSQHRNKEKALKVLRARLYDFEMQKVASERANNRKQQIGTGDRSERIRTYNFPQGRVTDHRLPLTLPTLSDVLGKGEIDPFIVALQQAERLGRLSQKLSEETEKLTASSPPCKS